MSKETLGNEMQAECLIKKFESDKEIRALLDEKFDDSVTEALKRFSEKIATHMQMYWNSGIFSDEEMKGLVNEYSWIKKFEADLYKSILEEAIMQLFKEENAGLDVRNQVIRVLKEKITPESIIAAINAFEAKRMEALTAILVLQSVSDYLDGLFDDDEEK